MAINSIDRDTVASVASVAVCHFCIRGFGFYEVRVLFVKI
jgi:hypothetical protein